MPIQKDLRGGIYELTKDGNSVDFRCGREQEKKIPKYCNYSIVFVYKGEDFLESREFSF